AQGDSEAAVQEGSATPSVGNGETDQGNENREPAGEKRRFGRRRRGRRGRGFPESKFDSRNATRQSAEPEPPKTPDRNQERSFGKPAGYQPIILPGESISKYRHLNQPEPT